MKTYAIFYKGVEYTCTQVLDTKTGEGIDITNATTGEHIGKINSITIPDFSEDDQTAFETEVSKFLKYKNL